MNIKHLLIGVLAISVVLSSCGKGTPTKQEGYPEVSKNIDSSGGQVKDEKSGLELDIPAGALKENTKISLQYFDEADKVNNQPTTGFLAAAEFGPSGTVFDEPVKVSMTLPKTPRNTSLTVFCYDEEYKEWDVVCSAAVSSNVATFEITHFSKYQALDITIDMYMYYIDLVKKARSENLADTWITEQYKDFLINEKHVMEYYEEFAGEFYEPCGLFFAGQYEFNGVGPKLRDDLIADIGESNKVGDTYGLSQIGDLTTMRQEYEKTKDKETNKQELINVLVVIDYKMIKPQFVLNSIDEELKKGESTMINVRCHYAKESNKLFPDIDLPNYKLEIRSEEGHIVPEKNEVTTNEEGCASFMVTSKDGKSDKITVKFEVTGDFGTFAEGSISISGKDDVKYRYSAHIQETFNYGYNIPISSMYTGDNLKVESFVEGNISISLEYDVNGRLTMLDDYGYGFVGKATKDNINISIEATKASHKYTEVGLVINGVDGSVHYDNYYVAYDEVTEVKYYPYTNLTFEGGKVGTIGYFNYDNELPNEGKMIDLSATGEVSYSSSSSSGSQHARETFDCGMTIYHGNPFYLEGIEIKEGTQTVTVEDWIETMYIDIPYDYKRLANFDEEVHPTLNQTITFTKI